MPRITRSLREDGKPIIEMYLIRRNGTLLRTSALIDTGTDFCHVPPDLLDQCEADFVQDMMIDSHNHTESPAKLYLANVVFPHGDDEISQARNFRAHVINTGAIAAPMIVGMELIKRFDFSIKSDGRIILEW